jgi:hypothetical protein
MSDRAFLDTSIFVYAVDNAEADKQKLAQTVLRTTSDAAVSTQVMNEFSWWRQGSWPHHCTPTRRRQLLRKWPSLFVWLSTRPWFNRRSAPGGGGSSRIGTR